MLGSENYTERETTGTTFTIIYEGHIYDICQTDNYKMWKAAQKYFKTF